MQLRSIVQCPHCGFKVTERMPTRELLRVWHCPACERPVEVSAEDCCVFCRFGSLPCPARQPSGGFVPRS